MRMRLSWPLYSTTLKPAVAAMKQHKDMKLYPLFFLSSKIVENIQNFVCVLLTEYTMSTLY